MLSFGVQVNVRNIYSMSCTGEDVELRRMGVLFNPSLKFGDHINIVVHKANRLLAFIKRALVTYLEPQMLLSLYTTLVKSHLDYACLIWNPYQSGDIRALEQAQRRSNTFPSFIL